MKTYKEKSKREFDILQKYLEQKNLKITKQRRFILDIFLSTESHISAEELYRQIKKDDPSIGLATIYRTLNLFVHCGLAQKRQFGDNNTRYEHIFNHSHHDHLICNNCGDIVEFENSMIERIQKDIASEKQFFIYSHKLEIYGLCKKCHSKFNRL